MAANKIIRIKHDGKNYTTRWTTGAFRQFLKLFKGFDLKQFKENEMMVGMEYLEYASQVLEGMLIRAGMAKEMVEEIDADQFAVESSKLTGWFMETISKMNAGTEEAGKNEKADTET